MADVYCEQYVNDVLGGPGNTIDPAYEGETVEQILQRKAQSHERHGWHVVWSSPTSFTARKIRWTPPVVCKRLFSIRG